MVAGLGGIALRFVSMAAKRPGAAKAAAKGRRTSRSPSVAEIAKRGRRLTRKVQTNMKEMKSIKAMKSMKEVSETAVVAVSKGKPKKRESETKPFVLTGMRKKIKDGSTEAKLSLVPASCTGGKPMKIKFGQSKAHLANKVTELLD